MKYTITNIRRKPITYTKKDGTAGMFNKIEVQTDITGDAVYELGEGHTIAFKESAKAGDVVTGYTAAVPWSRNGKSGINNKLNGITVEYLYNLLLKLSPGIEGAVEPHVVDAKPKSGVAVDGWSNEQAVEVEEVVGW